MKTDTSRIGVTAISYIFEKIGFTFREQPIDDCGIDAIVEERNESYLSGKLIGVQIKSGKSYFSKQKGDKVIYDGDLKHYYYWLNYSLPVILVLYNPETELCIYEVITKDKAILNNKGWKIELEINKKLQDAAPILHNLTLNESESQKKLSVLAFEKGLMKLAEQEKLIIEVQEWANKSSGRGEFIIKKVDDQGQEIKISEKTIIGFGLRPYDEVLLDVFPWVDLVIDEYYYDMYGDEEYIEIMKQYNDCLYPYKNSAGEVDFYRFRPVLNEIGEAFLTLDSFLKSGTMYQIKL